MDNQNTKQSATQSATQRLIPFLRKLADDIENDKLKPLCLRFVGEFYMSYQFQEQVLLDKQKDPPIEFSKDDLVKFIILGWYCYCIILDDSRFPKISEEINDIE